MTPRPRDNNHRQKGQKATRRPMNGAHQTASPFASTRTSINDFSRVQKSDSYIDNNNKSRNIISETVLLQQLPQSEQRTFQCVNYQMDEYSNYVPKFGDLEQWRIYSKLSNNQNVDEIVQDLWFLQNGNNIQQRRRVFVEGKVHRVWKIDSEDDTFEATLELTLSWLITKDEYVQCLNDIEHNRDIHSSSGFPVTATNIWHPVLHIPALVEGDIEYIERSGSKFRIISYDEFAGFSSILSDADESADGNFKFQIENTKFMRATINISGVFQSDFVLKNFPFDLQQLNIVLMEKSGRGTFMPALREKSHFLSVDGVCYEVKEWSLLATMLEFVDVNPQYDTSSFGEPLSQFIIGFKYKRYYGLYLLKYGLVTSSLVGISLLSFGFHYNEQLAERCAYVVGLMLTISFMDYQRPTTDEWTILDLFVIISHFYLVFMVIIIGVSPHIWKENTFDHHVFIAAVIIFIGYHIVFGIVSYLKHQKEMDKIHRTYSKDIARAIEMEDVTISKKRADYTQNVSESAHQLAFVATNE